MEKIENHIELAKNTLTPYMSSFNQIRNMAGISGERTQYIEDVLWKIIYSLDVDQAYGIWLDYIGKEVGVNRVFFTSPNDILTFNGNLDQGFGAGNFYSAGSKNSTKSERTDFSFRNAIKAKIIQNSTDCSVDELKKALKLLYNASIISLTESYPARISKIDLIGSSLYQDGNAVENIKKLLACCVSLNEINFITQPNLFRNNAFISYDNKRIPATDNFTLKFKFVPNGISDNLIPIISQSVSNSINDMFLISFSLSKGICFQSIPKNYSDESGNLYIDNYSNYYISDDYDFELYGGSILDKEVNSVEFIRNGNDFYLYLNRYLIDSGTFLGVEFDISSKLYIGTSIFKYYSLGSIYDIFLTNDSSSEIILSDNLKNGTTGNNNGVIFI